MIKPVFITLLALWALALTPGAMAQVASLAPLNPHVGDSLTITYNPKATGAKLTQYDISFQPTHIILNRDGKLTQRVNDAGLNRLKRLRALINYALY